MAKIETPAAVREAEELPPSEVRPRTFGQTLIHTLYSAPILGGLALAVAGASVAGYIYFNRGNNQPPREPPRIEQNGNPVVVLPITDLTPTPVPTPTLVPTPTPDIVNFPIIVECSPPACTPEELAYYNKRFKEEFDYLTDLFGIKPNEQFVFKSDDGNQFYRLGGTFSGLVGKVQIDSPDNGIRHELMHALLQTHIRWYDEGIAKLAAHFDSYLVGEDPFGGATTYDELKKVRKPVDSNAHYKGPIFVGALRKYFSKDGEDFKNKARQSIQEVYEIALRDETISENQIFDIHSKYFGDLTELKEIMSYLLTE